MAFYDDDVTDNLSGKYFRSGPAANKNGAVIQFYHVPTIRSSLKAGTNDSQATFKAFLTEFKDNFKVNWNAKETFGRMDAIQTYKNTQRNITLAFDVPSNSTEEADLNFFELQKLITMQYPVYETVDIAVVAKQTQNVDRPDDGTFNMERDTATIIAARENSVNFQAAVQKGQTARFMSSPPLLYIKFMNWIGQGNDTEAGNVDRAVDVSDALAGIVSDVNFAPDLDQGFHLVNSNLIPKLFTVNLNITVIHTNELGWVNKIPSSIETISQRVFGQPTGGSGDQKSFPYHTTNIISNKK